MFLAAVFCLATSAENYRVALGDVAAEGNLFIGNGVRMGGYYPQEPEI